MLLRLLAARLGNRDDAEDALQDMWLRLDQLASQPIAQPAAFLYRVASNLATDRRIAGARRGARDAAWLADQPGADDLPDAERTLVARDALRVVEQAIDAMPDRMGRALRLFRIEGRGQRAIAEELGISVSGVEKLLARAYRIIHARIAEDAADSPGAHRHDDGRGHRQ
ncbi:sigma-70 family RNA polymerase sigma factor [Sphingomonas sp. RP10(2022)]|uniref:Sigma-70 family RNA polymerase sigma factor n=1 Tax=Sphingomonas liriopis TaxID=2949094 RepID=A0A9X2HPV1_9SPHN|nr:sigma-70 family RNA polymerase sigma factor [Sphingomonas liriopis]MCP3733567.1 sigma-70 family RNA polymerase sigma factor [Sphingomonas liriopis]